MHKRNKRLKEKTMELKGSKTEKNLQEALKGESVARNKYTYYSSKAKKEGYVQLSKMFEEIANNEKEHAKIWFKLLMGGDIPSVKENLKDCISGENFEHTSMYPEFSRIAREEGFDKIAKLFENVAKIEHEHELRYKKLLQDLENDEIFKQQKVVRWECSNCGYIHEGNTAPDVCPVCSHKQAYFFIR